MSVSVTYLNFKLISVMGFGHLNKNLYKESGDESVKNSNVVHAHTTSKSLKECLKWSGGILIVITRLK